jgi:hypothetical protein
VIYSLLKDDPIKRQGKWFCFLFGMGFLVMGISSVVLSPEEFGPLLTAISLQKATIATTMIAMGYG